MANLGENSVKGTEFKLIVSMVPIDGHKLADVEWEALIFTESGIKSLTVRKTDAKRVDDDNYTVIVDSTICGAGKYYMTLTAYIPDTDFPNGFRTEKRTAFTGVTIDAR